MSTESSSPDPHPSDAASEVPPELRCANFEACGNETPGPNNGLCTDCLDAARARDR